MTDEGDEDERMLEIMQEEVEDLKRQLDVANRDKKKLHDALEAMAAQMLSDARSRDEDDATYVGLLEGAHAVHKALISLILKPYCNGFVAQLPTSIPGYKNGSSQGSGYWFFPDYESAKEALLLVVMERVEGEESSELN